MNFIILTDNCGFIGLHLGEKLVAADTLIQIGQSDTMRQMLAFNAPV